MPYDTRDTGGKPTRYTPWKAADPNVTLDLSERYGYTTPDYNHILEILLAPLKAQSDMSLAQQQAQADALMELYRRNSNLSMDDLKEQYDLARRGIKNTLAAQGLYDSGDLGFRNEHANRAYSRAQNQEQNRLREALMGIANSLANSRLSAEQALKQKAIDLLPVIQQNYAPAPVMAGPAQFNPYGRGTTQPLNLATHRGY